MQAREIMTENPVCVTPADGLQMAARQMVEYNCGFLPVVDSQDSGRLVGVVTDRDIVARVVARGIDCNASTVQDAMTTGKLWCVNPDTSVDEVIEKMEEGQVRRIPVVDADNCVVGVIATADIALELDEADEIAEVFEEISEPTNIPHA
ncbi:MAG: Hypoxic response protein 1 [bacterium ADurb.Bin429]|nr:MAG: Hypoxic response protein 1 [bacterium ADurb.Bin429]